MAFGKEAFERTFYPDSVAVVGASGNPEKLGYHCMKSLTTAGFQGRIHPVNPNAKELFGRRAHPSLTEVPDNVDLAIVVVGASLVPSVIEECILKGVGGVVLITAGFREIEDPQGERMQQEVAKKATENGIRVIGPNTFGFLNLHWGLNASFTPELSRVSKGSVALISQSGGICHLMVPLFARNEGTIGFSKIVGLGNRANTEFADLLQYLAGDSETDLIMAFIEGTERGRPLCEALMSLKGKKPVVAYKAGRSEVADRAARSHTGSLAGRYEVYRSAFTQAGVVLAETLQELVDFSKALLMLPVPRGGRIAILSAQAGPGIVACDTGIEKGLHVVPFSERTARRIEDILPPLSNRSNPVDFGPAWYDGKACREVIRVVLEDSQIDGLMVFAAYASANEPLLREIADVLEEGRNRKGKPIVTCFPSPPGIWEEERKSFEKRNIPVFPTPERAMSSMAALVAHGRAAAKGQ